MKTIPVAKKLLRQNLKLQRKLYHEKYSHIASIELLQHFKNFLQILEKTRVISIVAGYYPIESEIDIMPTMKFLTENGFIAALPKINKQTENLSFIKWSLGDELSLNHYDIYEPNKNLTVKPDIILVPTLGFDKEGNRIGYGGGFYDRTIPLYPEAIIIGCAYTIQETSQLPCNLYDQKIHAIVTEKFFKMF